MKYKLRDMLIHRELNGFYTLQTGKNPESFDARTPPKDNIGKPALQFRYCWQSNDNKRIKDLFKTLKDK